MKNNKILTVIIFLIAIICTGVFCTGCGNDKNRVIIKDVSMKCEDGTYIKAQVIIPEDYKTNEIPLVTLGHGYGGTMNSAGGDYLAQALAENGFATIRMDYNHYTSNKLDKQTNSYTVNSMIEDQLLCIEYMIDNYNVDKTRIGLYGRSLGGRVAMEMANENGGKYNYKAMALVAPAGNESALIYYMHGEDKWEAMKAEADVKGYVVHQKVKLTPEFFDSVDKYIPSEHGEDFDNPVLVIYNTLDNVVLPETSLECAASYRHCETVEITSENGHGYEMGYKKSEIKDMLINKICDFFNENL